MLIHCSETVAGFIDIVDTSRTTCVWSVEASLRNEVFSMLITRLHKRITGCCFFHSADCNDLFHPMCAASFSSFFLHLYIICILFIVYPSSICLLSHLLSIFYMAPCQFQQHCLSSSMRLERLEKPLWHASRSQGTDDVAVRMM